jgi:AraC-like DNA-binding protein
MSRPAALEGLQVMRGRSQGGSWELVYGRCHPALAPHVREYCGYREQTAGPRRRREMPAAQVVLIIDFGPTLRLLDSSGAGVAAQHPGGFLAGIDDGITLTETSGLMEGMQVNFTPIGARLFVGRPIEDLARQVVSLEDALGRDGVHLAERLQETRGWVARFRLLDELILGRMSAAGAMPGWVGAAWDRIESSGGNIAIERLVAEMGYSRKHLGATFKQHLGMAPKPLARLVRFQRALQALRRPDQVRQPDLARLALDLGYYDQAHFSHEFRGFSGLTPGECLRRQQPGTLGIAESRR